MKIKTGFVTNSSSSSFIVFWPEMIRTIYDVSKFITRVDFSKTIYDDSMSQEAYRVNEDDIENIGLYRVAMNILTNGWVRDLDRDKITKEIYNIYGLTNRDIWKNMQWYWQADAYCDIKVELKCKELLAKKFKENKGRYVYIYNYGDENGEYYAELEHNNNWGGLPHMIISNH